jgi:TolA-binding protein
LLGQAEDIVRARNYAKAHKTDRAKTAYEQVIKKHPDTPVAKLAAEA